MQGCAAYVGRSIIRRGSATAILRTVDRVHVTAPASSANLGPGYDCLGVALPLRNDVVVERSCGPARGDALGDGADDPARRRDEPRRPVVPPIERADGRRAALHAHEPGAAALGHRQLERGDRGGARSRARVHRSAGRRRHAAAARDRDRGPPRQRRRGDPRRLHDRARRRAARSRAASRRPPGSGSCSSCRPTRSARQESRKALRPEIPRADAVYSLQRSALLVDLLATGALELLPRALSDRMHEPDRAALTPMLGQLRGARRQAAVLRRHALGRRPERARVGAGGGNRGGRRGRARPACRTRR